MLKTAQHIAWTASALVLAIPAEALAQTATAPPPGAAAPGCTAAGHDQFDFWLGDWDVYATGTETLVARSKIEKLYRNCAVRENWMPNSGNGGGSLNSYDPATKQWVQRWTGSQPGYVDFVGGFASGKMVLTGRWAGVNGPGKDALVRMTYSRYPDGSVRQFGEQSVDFGQSWTNSFDFHYRVHRTN
jgi:hypothetical protein